MQLLSIFWAFNEVQLSIFKFHPKYAPKTP